MVCVCVEQVGDSLNVWCVCVWNRWVTALMCVCVCVEQVGLAVDDIKAVQEQAALKRMAMQVK